MCDICFACTFEQLMLQIRGGLHEDEITGIFADEDEARLTARELLGEYPVRPCDALFAEVVVNVMVQPNDEEITARDLAQAAVEAVRNALRQAEKAGLRHRMEGRVSMGFGEVVELKNQLTTTGSQDVLGDRDQTSRSETMNDICIPQIRCRRADTTRRRGGVPAVRRMPPSRYTLDYDLASEAMVAGTLVVQEVSEEGSVCELAAKNLGDRPVLLVEGEELKGAKQNRAVVSSVLVAGRSRARIPVCCVQRGKWEYSSRQFSPGSCCPPTMRHLLKQGDGGIAASSASMRCGGKSAGSTWRRRPVRKRKTSPTLWRCIGSGSTTCGSGCGVPEARRGSPSSWAGRSCRWTCSTGPRPWRSCGIAWCKESPWMSWSSATWDARRTAMRNQSGRIWREWRACGGGTGRVGRVGREAARPRRRRLPGDGAWSWTAYRYTSACRCPPWAKKGMRKHGIIHLAYKANFETLQQAFLAGDVALMECQLAATGEPVAVVLRRQPA